MEVKKVRKFLLEVKELSKKYNVSFFIVSDGASMCHNITNNPAVRNAREKQIEWEKIMDLIQMKIGKKIM